MDGDLVRPTRTLVAAVLNSQVASRPINGRNPSSVEQLAVHHISPRGPGRSPDYRRNQIVPGVVLPSGVSRALKLGCRIEPGRQVGKQNKRPIWGVKGWSSIGLVPIVPRSKPKP
jgi:hypothetical protein